MIPKNPDARTGVLHFVCGSTGSGKTTFAQQLAQNIGGIRFSVDEWMSRLFWMDAPEPIEAEWAQQRVERCTLQIWTVATDIARAGVCCVLELGWVRAATRAHYLQLAREAELQVAVHVLQLDKNERWRRVEARNSSQEAAQLPFAVTRAMFDYVESLWQPPDAAEIAAASDVEWCLVGQP